MGSSSSSDSAGLLHPALLLFGAILLTASCQGASDTVRADWKGVQSASPRGLGTAFGFTTFPYDVSQEAVERTHSIAAEHGNLYAVHFDNGIPWKEALEDGLFPDELEREWNDLARRIPKGRLVYVALAPLATDRKSLAPPSKGSSLPRRMRGVKLDDELVRRAWLNYVRRAIDRFHPDYINLGIEAGEMAGRDPDRWPQFVALYDHVRGQVKKDHPDLQVGISFGLQLLLEQSVAARARPLVESSDYLGLSFYPYMSEFHERFGAAPLSAPPEQWLSPLRWAREYTRKPIAICETGYTTQPVDLDVYGVHMAGAPDLQERYVQDLGRIARHDGYPFVVWYLAVDYDALYEKLPAGDGSNLIWRNIGFFDRDLSPKKAWSAWREVLAAGEVEEGGPAGASARGESVQRSALRLGFAEDSELFQGPAGAKIALDDRGPKAGVRSMRWSFEYEQDQWAWCLRTLAKGQLEGTQRLRFQVCSDREGPVVLQLEEQGGEAFFALVPISREWSEVSLETARLTVDQDKLKDGRLDVALVTSVMLADAAAKEDGSATGQRSVWIADWTCERAPRD